MTHSPDGNMTTPELRKFGLITGIIIIVFIGGFLPWLKGGLEKVIHWQLYTAPVGGVLISWALLHPASLIHFYKPWMKCAEALGFINTRIILFIVFAFMFVPIGLLMRLLGKDPMHRQFIHDTNSSYRVIREQPTKDHMETPY